MNGTKLTMNGSRPRLEKDTNSCKIVLLGCPGVGKTGTFEHITKSNFNISETTQKEWVPDRSVENEQVLISNR